MHVLLFVSVFLAVLSTSFLTLIFENKNIYRAICLFCVFIFAQIVLTFECLSLFSSITPLNIVVFNSVFALISSVAFRFFAKKQDFCPMLKSECLKFRNAIKHDMWLRSVLIAFLLCLVGSLIYAFFVPSNDEDALSYHLARLPFWYSAKNLNHFLTADIRALIMPINSEIFYFWAYSFIKSDIFVRFFSFGSFILFVAALRGFFKSIGISLKTSLWVILCMSAMQNVMFSISGTETNITVAALIMTSLFLFLYAILEDKTVFFSVLAYALAMGTKTTAIMVFPAFMITAFIIAKTLKKQFVLKQFLKFILFLIINFAVFASYNYILNYLDFGNFIGSQSGLEMHRFYGGIKGFIANIIRFFTMLVDFTGVPFGVAIWRIEVSLAGIFISLLGINPDINMIVPDTKYFVSGNNFENMCGLGVLSFLAFLPSLYFALKRIKKSDKSLILGTFGIAFIINFVILSASLGYMIFSVRFLMMFVMLSSPVLVYLFLGKKDRYRKLLAVIMIYTFTFSYFFFERRFTPYLMYVFYKNPSTERFKSNILCANTDFEEPSQACKIVRSVREGKLLYFASSGTNIYYPKHFESSNFQVDYALLETTNEKNIDWQKYDYIAVPNVQLNTNVSDFKRYRNAIELLTDKDGKVIYKYNQPFFADCVFVNLKNPLTPIIDDEKKVTSSRCRYRADIFEKHGFKEIKQIPSYDNTLEEKIILYKNKS